MSGIQEITSIRQAIRRADVRISAWCWQSDVLKRSVDQQVRSIVEYSCNWIQFYQLTVQYIRFESNKKLAAKFLLQTPQILANILEILSPTQQIICNKVIVNNPPHLKRVAILPRETLMLASEC